MSTAAPDLFQVDHYPRGLDLIDLGICPLGAENALACWTCPVGHALECHYPMPCEEAHCAHFDGAVEPALVAQSWAAIREENDRQGRIEAGVEHVCAVCGCSESQGCPGGCVWAKPTLCSRCALGEAQ